MSKRDPLAGEWGMLTRRSLLAWSWDGKSCVIGNRAVDLEPWSRGELSNFLNFEWDWTCT